MRANKFPLDRSGGVALEFALVLPILMLILCGALVYGTFIGAAHGVAQLAADAARASVAGLNDAERTKLAVQHVEHSAKNYIFLTPEDVTVSALPSQSNPDIFQIAVTYDASDLPIWGLGSLLPLPSKQITRTASIGRGGL